MSDFIDSNPQVGKYNVYFLDVLHHHWLKKSYISWSLEKIIQSVEQAPV